MKTVTATMKFKVPADSGHPQAGETLEGNTYDYEQAETVAEAEEIAAKNEWTLLDFVNEALKGNARQNKYSNLLATYAPKTEVSQDVLKARLIRTFIMAGLTEEQAKAQVESVLSANNG